MPKSKPITLNAPRKPIKGTHRSLTFKTEPLRHDFDERKLVQAPAQAIRDTLEKAIRSITTTASRATLARRRARNILGTKLFNATGKLARGLTVRDSRDAAQVVAPADRFTDNAAELLARLRDVVPELDPRKLMKDRKVREAVAKSTSQIISKGRKQ